MLRKKGNGIRMTNEKRNKRKRKNGFTQSLS